MSTRYLALVSVLVAAAVSCSPAPPGPNATPKPAAKAATPKPAAKAASPAPSPVGTSTQLGDFTYVDYGMREVQGKTAQELDAGNFYFKGTFLQGSPGQLLKLRIANVSELPHNLSIPSQQVDQDIPVGRGRTDVDVTLPESGALRFFCKYHTAQGMNGQLLAGETMPQPVSSDISTDETHRSG